MRSELRELGSVRRGQRPEPRAVEPGRRRKHPDSLPVPGQRSRWAWAGWGEQLRGFWHPPPVEWYG